MKEEFCIMPPSTYYSNIRLDGMHRHEIFFGEKNRQKSIKYGLVVFLTLEQHNMSNVGVHFNHEFDLLLKQLGQQVAMEHYGWSVKDFITIFGKNYL